MQEKQTEYVITHKVLYKSQYGSSSLTQDKVATVVHPSSGTTLSKSGWTSLWLWVCGYGIFISRLRCFLMSQCSCTPWWGGEATGNRLQHPLRGNASVLHKGRRWRENNKQSLIVFEIEDLGLQWTWSDSSESETNDPGVCFSWSIKVRKSFLSLKS